jgi:hypothetical protein
VVRSGYVAEARRERLKQAAWTLIYRYEKLLHENENKELETEIAEFSRTLQAKDRQMAYEKMKEAKAAEKAAAEEGQAGKSSSNKKKWSMMKTK